MKNGLVLALSDAELFELYHILVDKDGAAAIEFLNTHLRKQIIQAMEGGWHVMIEVPGAGIQTVNGLRLFWILWHVWTDTPDSGMAAE